MAMDMEVEEVLPITSWLLHLTVMAWHHQTFVASLIIVIIVAFILLLGSTTLSSYHILSLHNTLSPICPMWESVLLPRQRTFLPNAAISWRYYSPPRSFISPQTTVLFDPRLLIFSCFVALFSSKLHTTQHHQTNKKCSSSALSNTRYSLAQHRVRVLCAISTVLQCIVVVYHICSTLKWSRW